MEESEEGVSGESDADERPASLYADGFSLATEIFVGTLSLAFRKIRYLFPAFFLFGAFTWYLPATLSFVSPLGDLAFVLGVGWQPWGGWAYVALQIAVLFVLGALLEGGLTVAILEWRRGRTVDLPAAAQRLLQRFLPLLEASILQAIMVLGFGVVWLGLAAAFVESLTSNEQFLIVVVGALSVGLFAYLSVPVTLLIPCVVAGRQSIGAALRRSFALSRGRVGPILGVYVVLGIIVVVLVLAILYGSVRIAVGLPWRGGLGLTFEAILPLGLAAIQGLFGPWLAVAPAVAYDSLSFDPEQDPPSVA